MCLQSPTLVCPFSLQCTASKTNDSTEQNLAGNSLSLFPFLLMIGSFSWTFRVAGPSGLKMNSGALWDEVVDCIVLGSYPILEITIQSTVFPTVVHCPPTCYIQLLVLIMLCCFLVCVVRPCVLSPLVTTMVWCFMRTPDDSDSQIPVLSENEQNKGGLMSFSEIWIYSN